MESSTTYVALKDGFEITLSKTDSELTIEAEDQGNGNTFSSKFSNDAIKSMSRDLFGSVSELYEGLLTAFDGISEETKVTVNQEGKLIFTQKVMIGKNEKVFNFEIPLKLTRLEKQFKKLSRDMEAVRKENQRLHKENQQFKKEIQYISDNDDKCADYETISPCFNPAGANRKQFEISQDLKKITRNGASNGAYYVMGSKEMLTKGKNSKFHVKIDALSTGPMGIVGVGLGIQGLQNDHVYQVPGSYCISSSGVYDSGTDGMKSYSNYSALAQGSIIGILFMPSKGRILFDVDGVHVYTAKVTEAHVEAGLYPFVSMTHQRSSASFL